MALEINVESNISALTKAMDAFGKDQLPFATSKALNDAAKAVRETIVEKTYPQSFEPKSKGFAKAAFFRAFANKRKLEARVFDRFEKDYLVNQAKGGVKKKRGRFVAIPAQERPKVSGRKSYHRVHPRNVLNRPKAFVQNVNGQPMILERRTKKRYPLKRLYILHNASPVIPKRFPFYEVGIKVAQDVFGKQLPIRFKEAKKDAFSKSRRRAARMR